MTQRYCSNCGQPTAFIIPEGDHLPRNVCQSCGIIHYENPNIVVGCVVEYEGLLLLCRRAIEPRRGFWTFPAGFMENGETLEEGAARESQEEALARVAIDSLLAVINIPEARQVHIFFRGHMMDGEFGAGPESLESKLVPPDQIPWDEIAFPSTRFALEKFLADRAMGSDRPHLTTLARFHPG